MLLANMGFITKQVKVCESSGYEPEDIDLAFLLWASLRSNFFAAPPPPLDQWESQLDFQVDVQSRGLFVADSASNELRAAAQKTFGKMYLGCIH
jgi:hypothetical protein